MKPKVKKKIKSQKTKKLLIKSQVKNETVKTCNQHGKISKTCFQEVAQAALEINMVG